MLDEHTVAARHLKQTLILETIMEPKHLPFLHASNRASDAFLSQTGFQTTTVRPAQAASSHRAR